MIIPKQKLQTIISYLDGTMTAQEVIDFEALLAEDEKLAKVVHEQRLADELFFQEESWVETEFELESDRQNEYFQYYNNDKNQEFFQQLQTISPKQNGNAVMHIISKYSDMAKVASVAAVACFIFFLMPSFIQGNSSDKLYTKFSDYDSLLDFTMKSANEDKLVIAEQFFEEKNYELATPLFADLVENADQRNDLLRIYFAICLAESDQADLAIDILNDVTENNNSLYQAKAKYFAGLFHLKNENEQLALEHFEDYLSEKKSQRLQYVEEAEKLVKKLKK